MDDRERLSSLRHEMRNRLSTIRNAMYFLRKKTSVTPLWTADPRIAAFHELIEEQLQQLDLAVTSRLMPPSATPRRALIVDDQEAFRVTLGAVLEDAGFQVDLADSQADALSRLDGAPFEVAIIDVRLGSESGASLLPEVRAHSPGVRVVVVSGDIAGIESAGADAVLLKDGSLAERLLMLLG